MVPSIWSRLNRYGQTVVGAAVLGVVVPVVTGSPRDGVLVFVGITGAISVVATYRASPEADTGQQQGERTEAPHGTDRKQKQRETRKAASDGYFSK